MRRALAIVAVSLAAVFAAACCKDRCDPCTPCNPCPTSRPCDPRPPGRAGVPQTYQGYELLTRGCPAWPTPVGGAHLDAIRTIASNNRWNDVLAAVAHCRTYGKNSAMSCSAHEAVVAAARAEAEAGDRAGCLGELSHNDPLSPPPTTFGGRCGCCR